MKPNREVETTYVPDSLVRMARRITTPLTYKFSADLRIRGMPDGA